jgi:hypothetical protein
MIMAELHILNPTGQGMHVFKGMFGTIRQVSEDSGLINFQPDPAIARCSSSMQALLNSNSFKVQPHEVVSIQVNDDVLVAIKASLARGLQEQWNRGYAQVLGSIQTRQVAAEQGNHRATLTAIPGLGQINTSMLHQAVQAEKDVANRGIEQYVSSLTSVAPYWLDIALKGVFVSQNSEGNLTHSNALEIEPKTVSQVPVPMAGWGDADHLHYSPTQELAPDAVVQAGFYDVTAAIPVYLPVQQGGHMAQAAARLISRAFRFGSSGASDEQAMSTNEPSIEKAQEVMDIIMGTPILREMVVNHPAQAVLDYNSRTETTLPLTELSDDDYDEDEDSDPDYDEPYQARPRP